MSLIFEEVSYKNFLSTGNVPNVIYLNKYNSTLITGKNGEGKSTILCALTFGLFGKPFRNVSKPQLVNSINKKNCLVEVKFTINGHRYLVRRGIKPNIFEIFCDDNPIIQDAAVRDYQKVLEQQILKLNYKTFTQVVILGAATFVPFMQLPAMQRREVIEDILDIRIFSFMNQLLKKKVEEVKEQMTKVDNDILACKTKISSQRKLIKVLETNRQLLIDNIESKIQTNNDQIEEAQEQLKLVNQSIEEIKYKAASEQISDAVNSANKMKVKLTTNLNTCQHTVNFFQNNTTCPTCSQEIIEEYKDRVLNDIDQKIAQHREKLDQVNQALTKFEKKLREAEKYADKLRDFTIEISTISNKINLLTSQNAELRKEMQKVDPNLGNLLEEQRKLEQLDDEALNFILKKNELLENRQLHDIASSLLKDTGIKTAIIREYLPVMNKLINKYLSAMDFFVKFELDESFQEVIKSRNRDIFTYESFSEGEKQKIDLALMFAWRQIAKMKNSVNTNLLIMDEIFDSSLDSTSSEMLLTLLDGALQDTNIFIISHREAVAGANFQNVIRMKKTGDFSILVASKD